MSSFNEELSELGLSDLEFARLAGVSAKDVRTWSKSDAPLPRSVQAYLSLLKQTGASAAAKENQNLEGRARVLDEGIYAITYRTLEAEFGGATAVLRNGMILGSDREGGVFSGGYQFDAARNVNRVCVRFAVPPERALVTGFCAGPGGASVDMVGEFESLMSQPAVTIRMGDDTFDVELRYLGPLPN